MYISRTVIPNIEMIHVETGYDKSAISICSIPSKCNVTSATPNRLNGSNMSFQDVVFEVHCEPRGGWTSQDGGWWFLHVTHQGQWWSNFSTQLSHT